jgi:hypothetical protein
MDSRPPILAERNLTLALALAAFLVVGGLGLGLFARGWVAAAETKAQQLTALVEDWVARRALFEDPEEQERRAWQDDWSALLARVRPVADDSELTATVAEVFGASALRNL